MASTLRFDNINFGIANGKWNSKDIAGFFDDLGNVVNIARHFVCTWTGEMAMKNGQYCRLHLFSKNNWI
jgi:hypothetical protein